MTTSTNLFNGQSVAEYLQGQTDMLNRQVNRISTVEDLDAQMHELAADAGVVPCTLRRDEADFNVSEGDTTVRVEVKIPLNGNPRLLSVSSMTPGVGPYATVNDGHWERADPTLTLGNAFPAGTSGEEVRAWAKQTVDSIEARLAEINAQVEDYNSTSKSRAYGMIDARRRVLQTGSSLRDDLGGGI